MKVVINACFGGFSLSQAAVKRLAELQGRECYFFSHDHKTGKYTSIDSGEKCLAWSAFDVPNPNEVLGTPRDWLKMSMEERRQANELSDKHAIEERPDDRSDPLLIQVIEELGEGADGDCASLKIVEIPDSVQYEIEEYDGNEHVAEKHRTWG